MKKVFNMTIAVEVESETEIENLNNIDLNVSVDSQDAKIKVLDIPESYEVLM